MILDNSVLTKVIQYCVLIWKCKYVLCPLFILEHLKYLTSQICETNPHGQTSGDEPNNTQTLRATKCTNFKLGFPSEILSHHFASRKTEAVGQNLRSKAWLTSRLCTHRECPYLIQGLFLSGQGCCSGIFCTGGLCDSSCITVRLTDSIASLVRC